MVDLREYIALLRQRASYTMQYSGLRQNNGRRGPILRARALAYRDVADELEEMLRG